MLLTVSAHATLALTPVVRTPARTQILSAPGFGLALAATIAALARLVAPRWRPAVAAALGAWVVAVGTGRVVAMQAEWDASRSLYPAQAATLSALVRAAPGLEPGSLVLLLDDGGAWPMTFTFRHALRYLYGDGVVGIVRDGADFLYPWRVTGQGIVVDPWPVIRREWQVAPTLHPWDTILVVAARRGRPARGPADVARRSAAAAARRGAVRARGADPADPGARSGEACPGREGAAVTPPGGLGPGRRDR